MDPSFIRIITFSGRAAANYCSLKLQNPPPVWKRSRCAILHKVKPTPPPSPSLPSQTRAGTRMVIVHTFTRRRPKFPPSCPRSGLRAVYCFQMESRSAAMPADDHLLAPSRNPAFSLRNLFRMHFYAAIARSALSRF